MCQTLTAENQTSRHIHLVYDDSASMIRWSATNTAPWTWLDRWGQAKYAMEVFAAMLEENDLMRVYYMSDHLPFVSTGFANTNAPPRITIRGSEPPNVRIQRIRSTVTWASYTPFDPVVRAFNDLTASNADERWLVVLTDGAFNYLAGVRNDQLYREVNSRLTDFARNSDENFNIFLLAMGDDEDLERLASTITPNPRIGYHFVHARNSADILRRITEINNQIFRRNILRLRNEDKLEFNFDIPMNELFVFAQGPQVRISSINSVRGNDVFYPEESVNVRFSEVPTTNPRWNDPNLVKVSTELQGIVATFRNIPVGRYRLEATGAQTVEIYYKPDVRLGIKLFRRGREVRNSEFIQGRYRVRFGIIDERGRFRESELLDVITYNATVRNADNEFDITDGDIVTLKPGDLVIDAHAQFLNISISETMDGLRVYSTFEGFKRWLAKYWWLLVIIGFLILIFLLWGLKKKLPRIPKAPIITVTKGGNTEIEQGQYRIIKKTRWQPLRPQEALIKVSTEADVPKLHVRAIGGNQMKLLNADRFTPERLHDYGFNIGGREITNNFVFNNTTQIVTTYKIMNQRVTEECSLIYKKKTTNKNTKKKKR